MAGQYQALEGAVHILSWFQNGMGNYVEKTLVQESDNPEQFETIKQVLQFLQRYDLIEIPNNLVPQLAHESLFTLQFNAYLLDELKVETEVKRMYDGEEMSGIKDWTSYLNEKTILDFLKHKKEIAEQGSKEHEAKKASLHDYLKGKQDTPIQPEISIEPLPNNVLRSTVEDWIDPFKAKMNDTDYNTLVTALEHYFTTGSFPPIAHEIKLGKVNKKKFGWALSQLYRNEKSKTLPVEYLLFAKQHISIFKEVDFDIADPLSSNIYKYLGLHA